MTSLTDIISNTAPVLAGILGIYRPLDATYLIGAILIAAGLYGLLDPIYFAHIFGVPFAESTHALFFPGIGGRNAAAGLTLLTLRVLEERRAMGVLMLCWTMAGFSDIYILLKTEGGENIRVHAVNICVLGVVGYGLLMGEG